MGREKETLPRKQTAEAEQTLYKKERKQICFCSRFLNIFQGLKTSKQGHFSWKREREY